MENIQLFLKEAIFLVVILLLSWGSFHLKNKFLSKVHADRLTAEMISKVLTVFILLIGLMLTLQVFGLDIVPLVTLSGIGAAILGFASKDVVANFFGGSMIYATRPFLIGDFIEIPSRKISGHVEEIGWYLTTLRDSQKRTISLPNSIFSTELLLNHSRITHRKIEERVRLRIVEPQALEKVIQQIRQLLKENSAIDQREEIDVFLLSIGVYGSEIEVKACTKTTEYTSYMEVKQQILLKIGVLA